LLISDFGFRIADCGLRIALASRERCDNEGLRILDGETERLRDGETERLRDGETERLRD
jgi:hypothetical protein